MYTINQILYSWYKGKAQCYSFSLPLTHTLSLSSMALIAMRMLQRLRYLRDRLSALPSKFSFLSSRRGKISNARLLLINSGTYCFLYSMGDCCRQRIEGHPIDWNRTGRMAILGCCLGPLDHLWYNILDRKLPAKTAATVGRKVLLDQLIMAPICCTVFYLGNFKLISTDLYMDAQ